ncbi:MAG: DUF2189 domain-containing protein [Wenzhouxiangellaceae bacterium]
MAPTQTSPEALPFAAPCRDLTLMAPRRWLAAGWRDYRASLQLSLLYGGALFLLSAAVIALAWWLGRYVLVLAMLSGFVFVAPLLATGLYSISRQAQRGEQPSLRRALQRMRLALGNAMTFALLLMVVFLVWARAASMVHVFFPVGAETDWFTLLRFLAIGSAVGSIFAAVSFAVSAFSLPMIVDRDVDMITACVTSVNAVLRNKRAMLVWISLIVLLTALGFATMGLGLVLVIPWLGYASYHGYVATIDSSDWPLNDVTADSAVETGR